MSIGSSLDWKIHCPGKAHTFKLKHWFFFKHAVKYLADFRPIISICNGDLKILVSLRIDTNDSVNHIIIIPKLSWNQRSVMICQHVLVSIPYFTERESLWTEASHETKINK